MRALGLRLLASIALVLTILGPAAAMTIERVESPGGIVAWLVQDHSQKVIALHFAVRGGAASDPLTRPGLSSLVAGLLDEGAGSLDSGAYQGQLADLSASISFDASLDDFEGSLETLSMNRDAVFELLRLSLTAPRFDTPAVERIRAELTQLIDGQQESPDALASMIWFRTQFPGHAYGRPKLGTKAGIASITPEDLKAYIPTRLGRDQLFVSVVGDISPADLAPLLDKTFGALPAKAQFPVEPADILPVGGNKILLIKKPIPQSVIFFGEQGIPVKDKDFYAGLVLNRILGGSSLTSRLQIEIREKRGLAYGISTGLTPLRHANLLLGQVGTQNARAGETIALIRQEWTKMRDGGPTAEEVASAKTYLNGSYPLGLDSTEAIAQRLLGLQLQELGIDYFERRPRLINAVTLADVQRVAKRLLDPAQLSFAIAGDPQGVAIDQTLDPDQ